MSIKFPDMQVLLSRTDQIPKITREGDPTLAGKMAPQIVAEMEERTKRVVQTPQGKDARLEKNSRQGRARQKDADTKDDDTKDGGRRVDVRA